MKPLEYQRATRDRKPYLFYALVLLPWGLIGLFFALVFFMLIVGD